MPSNDSPFNIIGSASKKGKPKSSDRTKIVKVNQETITKNNEVRRRLEEMNRQMDEIHRAIDEKLEQLSRAKGLTKEKIWQYIQNPDNFTQIEWDAIAKEKKTLADQVWGVVSATSATPARAGSSNRKGKYLGARRNWIPAR